MYQTFFFLTDILVCGYSVIQSSSCPQNRDWFGSDSFNARCKFFCVSGGGGGLLFPHSPPRPLFEGKLFHLISLALDLVTHT